MSTSSLPSGPRNILVVGVPRSGTSLTTAIFARKGYHVGWIEEQGVRVGDEHNPFGYFEADDVIQKNVEVFKRVGYPKHNTWLEKRISDEEIAAIARLEPTEDHRSFVKSYQAKAPWIWKDPRLCLTLGYWWKLMDPATTGVVFAERETEDIFRSFRRMGWFGSAESDRAEAFYRIDQHLRAAREAIQLHQIPHISISYNEYFETPDHVASRLSDFCRLSVKVNDLNVQSDLTHSSLRGRISAWLRTNIDNGPLRVLQYLRPIVPRALLVALFPEKKYTQRN